MYKIIENVEISKNIYKLSIENELICKSFLPGEFIVLMPNEESEKIPLTIYSIDKNVVSMIYQVVGKTTYLLSKKKDYIYSILGPLGNKSLLLDKDIKKVLFVAGGLGIAPIIPQAKYLNEKDVICDLIYGMKSIDNLILKEDIDDYFNDKIIVTEDGTSKNAGLVTDYIKDNGYDYIVAIGPLKMMKYVTECGKKLNMPTIVSLNPIMVDGTGMCGSCRVIYDGTVRFACVDGPEFLGELVDFDSLIKRNDIYSTIEGKKYLSEIERENHHGGCGMC